MQNLVGYLHIEHASPSCLHVTDRDYFIDTEEVAVRRYLASGGEVMYGDLRSIANHRTIYDFAAQIIPKTTTPYGRYPRVRLKDDLASIAKNDRSLVLVLENYVSLDARSASELLAFVGMFVERNYQFLESGKPYHLFMHSGAAPRIAD